MWAGMARTNTFYAFRCTKTMGRNSSAKMFRYTYAHARTHTVKFSILISRTYNPLSSPLAERLIHYTFSFGFRFLFCSFSFRRLLIKSRLDQRIEGAEENIEDHFVF